MRITVPAIPQLRKTYFLFFNTVIEAVYPAVKGESVIPWYAVKQFDRLNRAGFVENAKGNTAVGSGVRLDQ
jgi:hypothetical protein